MKMRVEVWGRECELDVNQKSPSVWIATGEHLGKFIMVENRSATSAAAKWKEAARYQSG